MTVFRNCGWALTLTLTVTMAGCSWQHDFGHLSGAEADGDAGNPAERASSESNAVDDERVDHRYHESRDLTRFVVSQAAWQSDIRRFPLTIQHVDGNSGRVDVWWHNPLDEQDQQISEGWYIGLVRTSVDPREILATVLGFDAEPAGSGGDPDADDEHSADSDHDAEDSPVTTSPQKSRAHRRREQVLATSDIYSRDTIAIRVQVKKIYSGLVELSLPGETCRHLREGDRIGLVRPTGSSTRSLMRVPPLLPVCFGSADDRPVTSLERIVASHRQLREIANGIRGYYEDHGALPPAVVRGPDGKPWHSWRVLLLPYLGDEARALHASYSYSEPWNGPNNRRLLDRCPQVYRHLESVDLTSTRFALPTSVTDSGGVKTAFSAGGVALIPGRPIRETLATAAGLDGSSSRFRDPPEQVPLVGTLRPESQIPWLKPTDCQCDSLQQGLGSRVGFAPSFPLKRRAYGLFLFADGTIRGVSDLLPMDRINQLLGVEDGAVLDFESDVFLPTESLSATQVSPPPGRVELLVSTGRRGPGLYVREQPALSPPPAEIPWNAATVSQAN